MVTLIEKGFKWNAETFDFGHRPVKEELKPGDWAFVENKSSAYYGKTVQICEPCKYTEGHSYKISIEDNVKTWVARSSVRKATADEIYNNIKPEKEDEILFHPHNDFDTICSVTVTTGKKIEIERQYQSIVKK